MSERSFMLTLVIAASALVGAIATVSPAEAHSLVAAPVDRIEDRFDRRENRFDRREDVRDLAIVVGPRDLREDRRDARQNVYDRREDRRDRAGVGRF